MKIGIIGASGGIAAKAYLPVYAGLQTEHEFTIYSRDLAKAEIVRAKYNFAKTTNILANLDLSDLVFIHAITSAHFKLAKHFLEKGIPVVMDKPISEDFGEVQELYHIAEDKNVLFMIAFNRRFAPMNVKLKEVANKNFVKVTKNLSNQTGDVKFQLYDIFIHPLDTMIYLLDDEIKSWTYQLTTEDNKLSRILVTVRTETATGLAAMNLSAGVYEEIFEVESSSGTYRLKELTMLEEGHGGSHTVTLPNGWASATYNRGFDGIVNSAIASVAGQVLDLKQDNILISHQIVSEILEKEL
ncbi:MAG TPA: Gfo/Idh/MocA family oxidoreductase [Lactovum miscens]|uniref:Gfo/Idh/MocA family protein n=1 Tax=Lactovum miscens TaxID=190387 RepID=UPI002ED9D164